MYHHLRGILIRVGPGEAVVEAGGVGYRVEIPFPTFKALEGQVGKEVLLYVVPYFREENHRLFGFLSEEEREFFKVVIGVRGFGPAHGLALLSGLPLPELYEAIRKGKPQVLQRVRGVGRKNAERIIVELREKLPAVSPSGAAGEGEEESDVEVETARLGLQGLGYSRAEAVQAVEEARQALPEGSAADWIKYALQRRT